MRAVATLAAGFAAGAALAWCVDSLLRHPQVPATYTDLQLRESVLDTVAHAVRHPEAIDVAVDTGIVRVAGEVLPHEVDALLLRLIEIPGVRKVHNALSLSESPGTRRKTDRREGVQS